MFTNTKIITVFHKSVDPVQRLPIWEKYTFNNVYWENCSAQSEENKGMSESDSILCIIPLKSIGNFIPSKDDLIAIGDAEKSDNNFMIMSVKDFRYGSRRVQHIEVTAK